MAAIDRLNGLAAETSLAIKAPCLVATVGANITLSGVQSIDGVTVGNNSERVLVKDQSDPRQNGIYIASSGIWQYAQDAGGNTDWTAGTLVLVQSGATNAGKLFQQTTAGPITIGTSNIVFAATSSLSIVALAGGPVGPFVAPLLPATGIWLSPATSPGILVSNGGGATTNYTQGLFQFVTAQGPNIAESGLTINWIAQTGYYAAGELVTNFKDGFQISGVVKGPSPGVAGAGHCWNTAIDMVIDSTYGAAPNNTNNFAANVELDMTNNGWDSSAGNSVGNLVNLFMAGIIGTYPLLAQIWIAPFGSGPGYGSHYGILFQNQYAIQDATIQDSTHSTTSYQDVGVHSSGISLAGTYSLWQIVGNAFSISPSGHASFGAVQSTSIPLSATGVDSSTSYIVAEFNGGASKGAFLHYTDGVSFNWGVGADPTTGRFTWYSGRFPGGAGTGVLSLSAAGKLTTNPSATGSAGLNVPSGTAPTSPADGDFWCDGTNVKFRVGGTTKTFTLT